MKAFVVPELNLGQMVHEVERCRGRHGATYISVPHAGGSVHNPEEILNAIWRPPDDDDHDCDRYPDGCDQPGRALPAHGPHAAHLVSGLRHRHHGQLFRPGAGRLQG